MQTMERKLFRGTNRLWGEFACTRCYAPLRGVHHVVGEESDIEGYHWRGFCNECWSEVENLTDEHLYDNYSESKYILN